MGETVRAALIQAHANLPKEEAMAKHVEMIGQAAHQGAELVCMQEICATFPSLPGCSGSRVHRSRSTHRRPSRACRAICGSSNGLRTRWRADSSSGQSTGSARSSWRGRGSTGRAIFCDPRGQIIAQASPTDDEVLVADLDLGLIDEVRTTWQFFRDRRPGTYAEMTALLP
jgi:predicted amidohydrolase